MENRLLELRKRYRYSREELERVSGINHGTIQKLENGSLQFENCKLITLISLASAFHVPVVSILPNELRNKIMYNGIDDSSN